MTPVSEELIKDKNEEISHLLYDELIPKEQIEEVFAEYYTDAEICRDFIGFVSTYYYLSKLIPKNWTIIDFGCGYNAQCFLFKDHKEFLAVDKSPSKKFKSNNCIIFNVSISDFLYIYLEYENNIDKTFAICNYVPSKDRDIIKKYFNNLYIFYPCK